MFACPAVCLFAALFACLFVCLLDCFVCLISFVCLFVCLFVSFVCLLVCLFVFRLLECVASGLDIVYCVLEGLKNNKRRPFSIWEHKCSAAHTTRSLRKRPSDRARHG